MNAYDEGGSRGDRKGREGGRLDNQAIERGEMGVELTPEGGGTYHVSQQTR